jgi:beta-lactamase regulating signal transducer with metallopeptidase domain
VNAVGLNLLGSALYATAFAVLGAVVYLAMRRSSPAAGALAAGSCLAMTAVVSLVAVSPWQGFWTFHFFRHEVASASQAELYRLNGRLLSDAADAPDSGTLDRAGKGAPGRLSRPVIVARAETTDFELAIARLLGEFERDLHSRASRQGTERWGWPAWLALGLLLSLVAGVVRLGIGILAYQRLRSRSQPITDLVLLEEIDIIRAELSCTRAVEARETAELTTPATFGWRRPVLLLPFDWRDWDPSDRRAVLAHELAHVRRGDFLTAVVAQVALALHFYHPLAHWLSARLRLEQELAADDWGARLSGGKPSYLASLARMALHQSAPAAIWPARAFLPSRGTFLRRIDMLRRTEQLHPALLSLPVRVFTIGFFAVLGIAIAGLRVSAGSAQSPSEKNTRQAPGDDKTATAAIAIGNDAVEVLYLPADTKMWVAVRPGTLLGRDDLKSLLPALAQAIPPIAATGIPPDLVEQATIFWEGYPEPPGQPGQTPFLPRPAGFVVRTKTVQDWKARLDRILGRTDEFIVDGQTCFRSLESESPRQCGYVPDNRTLVVTREDLIREIVIDRKAAAPAHAWDRALSKVSRGQIVLAIDSRWIRRRVAQGFSPASSAGDNLETISPLLEKTRAYAITIGLSTSVALDLIAETGTEADAKPVAETLRAVMTLGRNTVQGIAQNSRNEPNQTLFRSILPLSDALLSNASVDASGTLVHLQAKSAVELGELVKSVVPAISSENRRASAAISVNHLKQMGLAFHNYHTANGHFPSPVQFGGSKQAIPYSWRVAILPYIEEEPLYRQYNFEEPWDGPNNRKLIDKMPAIYSFPGVDGGPMSRSNTSYFVFSGEMAALGGPTLPGGHYPVIGWKDLRDGASNTILVVERRADVPWTKPEDIPFEIVGPLPELGGFSPDSFHALFADASVHLIKKAINPVTLRALITGAAGEVIDASSY